MVDDRRVLFATIFGLLACVSCSSTDADDTSNGQSGGTSGSAGSSVAGSNAAGSNAAGSNAAGSNAAGSNAAGSNAAGSGTGGRGGGAGTSSGQGGAMNGGRGGAVAGGAAGTQQGGAGSSSGGSAGSTQGGSAGSGGDGAAGRPASDAPADVYAFYCFDCHGERGAGTMNGPEIQHPVRDFSKWVVRNGLPGDDFKDPMEAIEPSVISDAVLETIFDWLDEPPQPTTGEGLYLDYCGNCHGADGLGGPTMRPITNELRELEAITREGAHLGEFENRREYMPAYPATRLTDAEVDLIYDYVESL